MSRSYKHTPVFKDSKAGNKAKKFANRKIRRKAKIRPGDIQLGKSNYICDYRFWGEHIWREESWRNLREDSELWQKLYRRK